MSAQPKILIVDDKAENLFTLERVLRKLPVTIIQANSGAAALALALEHSFFVAIVDVQMPEMDGLEATRQICTRWTQEQHPRWARPRIIAMTANAMQGDRELCLAAGMDDYLAKPIHVDELVIALGRSC